MGNDLESRLKDFITPIFRSSADREQAALAFREQERIRVRENDPAEIADARRELAALQQKELPRVQSPQPAPPGEVRRASDAIARSSLEAQKNKLIDRLDQHDGWSRDRFSYDNGRGF